MFFVFSMVLRPWKGVVDFILLQNLIESLARSYRPDSDSARLWVSSDKFSRSVYPVCGVCMAQNIHLNGTKDKTTPLTSLPFTATHTCLTVASSECVDGVIWHLNFIAIEKDWENRKCFLYVLVRVGWPSPWVRLYLVLAAQFGSCWEWDVSCVAARAISVFFFSLLFLCCCVLHQFVYLNRNLLKVT